ncbi:unnamed protein product [Alopecurus aequalis]
MSTYPVLNDQPIDQWQVADLKDELCRRNLPINGLKEDLVKRLFEELRGDILGGSPSNDDLKEDGIPCSADASVCQDAKEQNVDESPSQVAIHEGDPAVSVTEASKKSAVATTDVSPDAVVTAEEVSQTTLVAATDSDAPLVDSATADKSSLSDAVATKGDDVESAPSYSAMVKGASPQADRHGEIIADKAPEDGTKKLIVDYLPYYAASTNVKLDGTSAQGKLDTDIVEQEAVLSTPNAIVPHTDHLDVHPIVTAPGQNAETLIPKIGLGDSFMDGKDHEDSGHMNDACNPSLSETKDQVSEANTDIGSQIKCVLISHDAISTSVEGDVNADNSDLELEAKRDMVKPPCSIPSIGDDVWALDDDKEFSKNVTSLEEVECTTNMSLGKKADSPEGASPEKLNLDRSSANEPIEGDMMEIKHVIPNIRSDELGIETEVTSDHEVKERKPFDTVDSSVQTKDIVAEEKPVTASEKRKPEDQGVVAVEPIKRQRRVDNVKLPKEQTSKSSSDFPKDVVQPTLKRSFGRSDSTAGGDSHRQRIVPLPQKPATISLRIDRFVRPFTLKAVQELLGRTGSICSFWMDHIKTHCYVTYSSVDEAVATRNAVYNLQWPLNNGNYLVAEFVDPHEVKLKLEPPPPPPVFNSLGTDTVPKAVAFEQSKANQTLLPHGAGTSRGLLPNPQPLTKLFATDNPGSEKVMFPPPPKEPEAPAMSLNDLFKRTQASPMIYYLPLSEEEVAAKLEACSKRRRGG